MTRPRDPRGRFVPAPAVDRPWGIFLIGRKLGASGRLAPRRPGRKTALARKWAAAFATKAEAEAALKALERLPGWSYQVERF